MQLVKGLSESGTPPESVIENCEAAKAIVMNWINADIPRSGVRATYKNLYDGGLPLDQAELDREGQGSRANFNTKQAKSITDDNVNSYTDLRTKVINRADIVLEVDGASLGQNQEWSQILTEEYTWLLGQWPNEFAMYQKSDFNRIYWGIGPIFFPNDDTWQPTSARFGEILVGSNAPCNLDELSQFGLRHLYPSTLMYGFIRNKDVARKLGWNVEAVEAACRLSVTKGNNYATQYSPEDWERRLKNNQYGYLDDDGPAVPTATIHFREYNGKIKRKMICEFPEITEYLYQSPKEYDSFDQYLNPFFLNTAEGDWHSVRGLASQFFSVLKALDLAMCQAADMVSIASSVMIIPGSEADLKKMQAVQLGPVTILPPGVQPHFATFPNMQTGLLAFHGALSQTLQNTTGAYQHSQISPQGGAARTLGEVQAQIANAARLSASQQTQFGIQESMRHTQMVKRALNPNIRVDKPYGLLAKKFWERCEARGVPKKALHWKWVSKVDANLANGAGSAAARMMLADQKLATIGAITDPIAREQCKKEAFAEKFDPKYAERAFPKVPPVTLGQQRAQADTENNFFELGKPVPVYGWENPQVHLDSHIPHLAKRYQMSEQGGVPLPQIYQEMQVELPHIQGHLQQIVFDPLMKEQAKAYNQAFQQLVRLSSRVEQKLGDQIQAQQKEQQKMLEQQAAMMQAAQEQPDPIEIGKLQLQYQKFDEKKQMDRMKLGLKTRQQGQQETMNDISTALSVYDAAKDQQTPLSS